MPCIRKVSPFESSRLRLGRHAPGGVEPRAAGFTLLEVLVAIAVIGVLIAILLPVLSRARSASRNVNCLANLHALGLGFRLYTDQNHSMLPVPALTKASWESSLQRYVQMTNFACPADGELFPTLGSSYDWRDTGRADTTLAGKDITSVGRADLVLVFEALPGWHARKKINAATVDGSARSWDDEECLADLDKDIHAP